MVGIGFLLGVQVVPGPQGEGLQGSLTPGSQEFVTLAQVLDGSFDKNPPSYPEPVELT
jgi:hypothetical protein